MDSPAPVSLTRRLLQLPVGWAFTVVFTTSVVVIAIATLGLKTFLEWKIERDQASALKADPDPTWSEMAFKGMIRCTAPMRHRSALRMLRCFPAQ